MSFDAWGARRKSTVPDRWETPIYQTYDLFGSTGVWARIGQSIETTTNRGFTGHEHFDQVGIIHMNGRIYDPEIGRFLQADPMIQDPYDTQSLNRYSYVMNNPLSYTDPSGYLRLRKGWWRLPAAIAITVITSGAASGSLFAGTAFGTAAVANGFATVIIGGTLSGGIATGTLKGAVKGGIFAAITFGIAHGGAGGKGWIGASKTGGFNYARTFAHAITGGISAEVDGGKFGHGFASSVLSSGADKLGLANIPKTSGRIIANAIVAGTISELTGGKFANGAMSAAFRVAFNDAYEDFVKGDKAYAELKAEITIATNRGIELALNKEGLNLKTLGKGNVGKFELEFNSYNEGVLAYGGKEISFDLSTIYWDTHCKIIVK